MKTDLVIFDCDGVLLDSEIIAHRVGAKEMTLMGFPLTVEQSIKLFSGVAEKDMPSIIEKEYGKGISDSDMKMVIRSAVNTFQRDLKPVLDIIQVVDYFDQRGINKCIASNNVHKYIVAGLAITKMKDYFADDQIFSVSMVERGKPSPDLFLHAADKLQANVQNCIVIEDSVVGIEAAKAADMFVIGFLGGSHAKNPWYYDRIVEAQPNVIANDAVELLSVLKKL